MVELSLLMENTTESDLVLNYYLLENLIMKSLFLSGGYHFNKVDRLFTDYITDFYTRKVNYKGMEKAINKSLLNNLLGRFGMEIQKPITKTITKDRLDYIISTRKMNVIKEINENLFLVSYEPIIF